MRRNSLEIAYTLIHNFDNEMGASARQIGLEQTVKNMLPMYDRLVNSIAREIDEAYQDGKKDAAKEYTTPINAPQVMVQPDVNPQNNQYVAATPTPAKSAPLSEGFGVGAPATKRPPKEELEAAMKEEPSKAAIARRFGVNVATVYNWLDKYGLRERVKIDDQDDGNETPFVAG